MKSEPLFFRYLFVQLNVQNDNFANIRYTRGVGDFVRFGDQFGVISDKLIELLKMRCNSYGSIRSTLPKKGESIEIIEGPYKCLNAIYDCPNGDQRSFVLVNLLQNTVKLPLDNMAFKKVS